MKEDEVPGSSDKLNDTRSLGERPRPKLVMPK